MSKEEPLVINSVAKDIKIIISNDKLAFIDLGPGSAKAVKNNTVPLLKALEKNIVRYIPIDNQKHFLNDSIECVSNTFKNLPVTPLIGDIFNTNQIKELRKVKNKSLVFLSGGTIGNISEEKSLPLNLIKKLKILSKSVPKGSYFLITQDVNQDLASLKDAYDNIHGRNFVLNIFHLIKRKYNLDSFDPTAFKHMFEWDAKNSAVICSAKALISQNFIIEHKNIYIYKNQKIPIIKSYKYSYECFKKITKFSGLEIIKTYWSSQNRVAIHLLPHTP